MPELLEIHRLDCGRLYMAPQRLELSLFDYLLDRIRFTDGRFAQEIGWAAVGAASHSVVEEGGFIKLTVDHGRAGIRTGFAFDGEVVQAVLSLAGILQHSRVEEWIRCSRI